jgi:hypothetical protein
MAIAFPTEIPTGLDERGAASVSSTGRYDREGDF